MLNICALGAEWPSYATALSSGFWMQQQLLTPTAYQANTEQKTLRDSRKNRENVQKKSGIPSLGSKQEEGSATAAPKAREGTASSGCDRVEWYLASIGPRKVEH